MSKTTQNAGSNRYELIQDLLRSGKSVITDPLPENLRVEFTNAENLLLELRRSWAAEVSSFVQEADSARRKLRGTRSPRVLVADMWRGDFSRMGDN